MQFATSCFNRNLWLHYLKRFWPLAAAVFVLLLAGPGLLIIGALGDAHTLGHDKTLGTISVILYWTELVLPFGVAAASFVAAELVFHQLHSRKETQFIQGLPLTRTAVYTTAFFAGFALLVIPGICSMLVHMALLAAFGYAAAAAVAAKIILLGAVSTLLFFSAAVFSTIVAGNILGSILLYAAVNFTVVVIAFGAETPISVLIPGTAIDFSTSPLIRWLTPLFNMPYTIAENGVLGAEQLNGGQVALPEGTMLLAYAAAGALIAVLSGCLYRIRSAEAAGQTVAFPYARTVCKVLFALVIAAIGTSFVNISGLMDNGFSIVVLIAALLIFAALGWIIAEMLVNKTLRVFNASCFKPCGILLAILAVVCIVAWADPLNKTGYIPQEFEIESAQVMSDYGNPVQVEAQDATEIHQLALDNRDYIAPSQRFTSDSLSIVYTLKNGSQVFRTYRYNFETESQATVPTEARQEFYNNLDSILSKPDYALQFQFGEQYEKLNEKTLISASGGLNSEKDAEDDLLGKQSEFSTEEGMELLEAIKKDAEQGNLHTVRDSSGLLEAIGEVRFEWTTKLEDDNLMQGSFADIQVTKEMSNTVDWLKAHAK